MKQIVRLMTSGAITILLATGVAMGAGSTHATGASSADVHAIKAAIARVRNGEPASVDWYIAAEGQYAVVYDGCYPGVCNENQLVKKAGSWIVTCFTTEGKGQFGTCLLPRPIERQLHRAALCMAMPSVDGTKCTNAQ
jgi:hypothetical protein